MIDNDQTETIQALFRLVNDMRGEMKEEFEQLRGELRDAKRALGQDIDGVNASVTAMKATMDGHTARFRDMAASRPTIS